MSKKEKSGLPQGTICKLCKKVYILPCDGKRYDCANAVWVRSKGTVDIYRSSAEEVKTVAKGGKLPEANVNTKKRKRIRL